MNFGERIRTKRPGSAPELNELFGGSWAVLTDDLTGVTDLAIAVQLTEDSAGRKTVTGMVVLGDVITATKLHKISIAAIENAASLSSTWLRDRKARQPTYLAELSKLPPLKREEGMTPEQFSEIVAAHYRVWARVTPHPAAAMAAEVGVKPPTMAGWIREARLRGLLPPARGRSKAARA